MAESSSTARARMSRKCSVCSMSQRPGISGDSICRMSSRSHRCPIPVIFITGHGDIAMAVRVMKLVPGVPYQTISRPISLWRHPPGYKAQLRARQRQAEMAALRACFASLTPKRSRGNGRRSRGITEQADRLPAGDERRCRKFTAVVRCTNLLARSLPDLVRMAQRLPIHAPQPSERCA